MVQWKGLLRSKTMIFSMSAALYKESMLVSPLVLNLVPWSNNNSSSGRNGQHLLSVMDAQRYSKHFTYHKLFKFQNNSITWLPLLSPLYRWGNWNTSRLSNLLKVPQLWCASLGSSTSAAYFRVQDSRKQMRTLSIREVNNFLNTVQLVRGRKRWSLNPPVWPKHCNSMLFL